METLHFETWQCIHMFHMILSINRDYFPTQHLLIGFFFYLIQAVFLWERGNEVLYWSITGINIIFKGTQNTLLSYLENKILLIWFWNNSFQFSMVNVKGTVVLVHAIMAYRKNGGTAPFIPNLGTKQRWVVSCMLQLLHPKYPWKRVCVGTRAGPDTVEKGKISCLCSESRHDSSLLQFIA